MDLFDEILKQASSNTEVACKEIEEIDEAQRKRSANVILAAKLNTIGRTSDLPASAPKAKVRNVHNESTPLERRNYCSCNQQGRSDFYW